MSPQHSRFGQRVAARGGRVAEVRIRHRLPGRMRVQVSIPRVDRWGRIAFSVSSSEASFIMTELSGQDGVEAVEWNQRTGNFLIRHRPQVAPRQITSWLEGAALRLTSPAAARMARRTGSNRQAVRQDAAWAGWTLCFSAGVAMARLLGVRFGRAGWLPVASWLLTLMQGYNISPEREASAEGDEAIPALTTGLHVLQGNPIQLASIYTSRVHRYAATRHLQSMPLGRGHRGYPPPPERLRKAVARQGRTGWQGAALTWLLTGNAMFALGALLAGNPRPARVGGLVVQSQALRALEEAGIRLADWPDWERITALDGIVLDAALFQPSLGHGDSGGPGDSDGGAAVDPQLVSVITTLRHLGVGNIIVAGVSAGGVPGVHLEHMVQASGADVATPAAAQSVYERLVQRHAVAMVTADPDGEAEAGAAWRWVGPDGAIIQLGSGGARALVQLLRLAQRVEAACRRVQAVGSIAGFALTSLASVGRMPFSVVSPAVECVALLAAFVGATVEPPPVSFRPRKASRSEITTTWSALRAKLPSNLQSYEGLTSFEASLRRAEIGPNQPLAVRPLTPLGAVAGQLREPFSLILSLGAGVSVLIGQRADAVAMGILLGVNAVLGAVQEYRAGRSAPINERPQRPDVLTRRDGTWAAIPETMLVPGDLIRLEGGDVVPADAWVLIDRGALLDESSLTGESEGVPKVAVKSVPHDGWGRVASALAHSENTGGEPLHEASGTIWAGTHLIRGQMLALVFATGQHTWGSQLATTMNDQRRPIGPLQRELGQWFRKAVALSAIAGLGVALLGMMRGHPRSQMISTGVSMALAAVPEGLPAILTLSFAACAGRLRPGQVGVKRLGALEALGSVSVLCLDKTGTLTQNDMRVERLLLPGGHVAEAESLTPHSVTSRADWAKELKWAVLVGAGCNEVRQAADGEWIGDPMELALVRLADQVGFDHEDWHAQYPRVTERPFDAVAGYMAVLCGDDQEAWVLVKGAPERVIPQCTGILIGGERRNLSEAEQQSLLAQGMAEADLGRRLLSLAYRPAKTADTPDGLAQGLIYAGTVSFSDPLRPETAEALRSFQAANVRTVMITGDHVRTAEAIARQLRIGEDSPRVMTGPEVAALSGRELAERVSDVDVFARMTPHDKMRIVTALQRKGEVVAVTGDGVNDTPALRQADVGIALADGTPAAIEAADVLLMEDTLAGIVRCVQEGSRLRKRLRSATGFLASGNLGEMLFITGAMVLGLPPPLLPSQILLMNVFTDALPALGLALSDDECDEEAQGALGSGPSNGLAVPLERPSQLADAALQRRVVVNAVRTALSGLVAFGFTLRSGNLPQARTAGFMSAAMTQLVQVGTHRRSAKQPNTNQPATKREADWLPSSMLGAWGMLLAGLTIPAIRKWFHLTPMTQGVSPWGLIPPLLLRIASEGPASNIQPTSAGRNV